MILTHILNQVARDRQLLSAARDYFHFVTTFFEPIEVSATHVYHSALELSPLSSIIRKFYYHQRPHPSPRVVIGIPDSWDPSTSVSTKHSRYLSSTWSLCGRFVAAVTEEAMEIRDALTLELVSALQSTKVAARFKPGIAYSPDGHSLAGFSDTAIVIWDTQTGGVVGKTECEFIGDGLELVWSLDGKTICTISPQVSEIHTVRTYDVSSGTTLSPGTLQSKFHPYLWAYGKTFRVATVITLDHKSWTINTFEVGSTLTRIESLPFRLDSPFGAFSPITHRISAFTAGGREGGDELLILDARNSEVLLRETGSFWRPNFSHDGSVFAAFSGDHLHIWKWDSGRYTRWREFQQALATVQFSPTLSSILGHASTLLHVLPLDYSSTAPAVKSIVPTHSMPIPRNAYPPHGTYIATTHRGESTIAITNLRSQDPYPSQFIDTGFEISEIVLTGNVLLVKGPDAVVAWLLTEEGVVDGIFGNRRADRNDSLWEISPQDINPPDTLSQNENPSFWARLLQRERGKQGGDRALEFSVGEGIAAIGDRRAPDTRIYNPGTGEILKPSEVLLRPLRTWYQFHNPRHRDDCDIYHRDLHKQHEPLKSDWPISQTAFRDGWVRDPEGKHRMWLHARWRSAGNDVDWFEKVTTMRLKSPSELLIIKF